MPRESAYAAALVSRHGRCARREDSHIRARPYALRRGLRPAASRAPGCREVPRDHRQPDSSKWLVSARAGSWELGAGSREPQDSPEVRVTGPTLPSSPGATTPVLPGHGGFPPARTPGVPPVWPIRAPQMPVSGREGPAGKGKGPYGSTQRRSHLQILLSGGTADCVKAMPRGGPSFPLRKSG